MLTTKADYWFSRCVRERAGWKCELCGTQYPEGAQGLHCSHFFGRGNWAVRFDPLNAFAHCFGCHQKVEGNPHFFSEWARKRLKSKYDILVEKSNNPMLGKQARREKTEIAEHYANEYETMLEKRSRGRTGRLEFAGYL